MSQEEVKSLGPLDEQDPTAAVTPVEGETVYGLPIEQIQALADKILVCIIHRSNEGIHHDLTTSVGVWARLGMRVSLIRDPHGGFVEVTRASVVNTFLEYRERAPQIEYLVMIDADEAVDASAPFLLARHGKPVVSGIVCGFNSRFGLFACFTAPDENGMPRFPCTANGTKLPTEGLIKAHQVGTGLLCVRYDVFETMRSKKMEPFALDDWTRERSFAEGVLKKGEDICFSERCDELGIDRYVDASCHAGHQKVLMLGWPEGMFDQNLKSEDFVTNRRDYGG